MTGVPFHHRFFAQWCPPAGCMQNFGDFFFSKFLYVESVGSFRQFDGLHDPTLSKTEIQAQTQDEKLTGAPGLHIVPHMSRLILSPGR